MHMVLPADNDLPWTALLLGIWIPNFYYWGLNQYIMQRTLGSQSLAEGQLGSVFAAALKLVIPFIVCIPGIIAFTLYRAEDAGQRDADKRLNAPALEEFAAVKGDPADAKSRFPSTASSPSSTRSGPTRSSASTSRWPAFKVSPDAVRPTRSGPLRSRRSRKGPGLQGEGRRHEKFNENGSPTAEKELGLADVNTEVVTVATGEYRPVWQQLFSGESSDVEKQQELVGYDYDGALPAADPLPHAQRLAGLRAGRPDGGGGQLAGRDAQRRLDDLHDGRLPGVHQPRRLAEEPGLVGRACVPVGVVVGCLDRPATGRARVPGGLRLHPGVPGLHLARRADGLPVRPVRPPYAAVLRRRSAWCSARWSTACCTCSWATWPSSTAWPSPCGVLALVLAACTLVAAQGAGHAAGADEDRDEVLPAALKSFGLVIVVATAALYVIFW